MKTRTMILLAVLALLVMLASALCGCSTFTATERCQLDQYMKAHPKILKHEFDLDT